MWIKDKYNRYIDIPLADELEMQAWQSGIVHHGFIDFSDSVPNNSTKNNFENFEKSLDNVNNK